MPDDQRIMWPSARHVIGGAVCDCVSGRSFDVIGPTTEEVTGTGARGKAEDAIRSGRAGGLRARRLVSDQAVVSAQDV